MAINQKFLEEFLLSSIANTLYAFWLWDEENFIRFLNSSFPRPSVNFSSSFALMRVRKGMLKERIPSLTGSIILCVLRSNMTNSDFKVTATSQP